MRIAIVIHGNLRTFLMPLRENPQIKLCDLALDRVILPNIANADVFVATDCNDFYFEGNQYFIDEKKIEIINSDSFRLYPNIKFASKDQCRNVIKGQLESIIPNIKGMNIEDPFDCTNDPKYAEIMDAFSQGREGAVPVGLIGQYRKLNTLWNMMTDYEKKNGFQYDVILKIRFDNCYTESSPLLLSNYSFSDSSVYVSGSVAEFVYDWLAFGTRTVMEHYLRLYDRLGFTSNIPHWILENCPNCCHAYRTMGYDGNITKEQTGWKDECPICKTNARVWVADVTLSSEHHLFEIFKEKGIVPLPSRFYSFVYRYLDIGTQITLQDIISKNDLSGVELIDHCMNKSNTRIL